MTDGFSPFPYSRIGLVLSAARIRNLEGSVIQFACDSCGKLKKPTGIWILRRAAEAVGITVVRREVDILSAWNDTDAVHPLAVHFCSQACKDKYIAEWMGRKQAS